MKFHAPVSGDRALELPLAFGHFVPWFTIKGEDYPLPADEAELFDFMPEIEDWRHWNDSRAGYKRTHHDMPEIERYDSRDPKVIEWQIETALEYGIQGFIVNWYGRYSVENVITLHWLRGLKNWNDEHPEQPFYYFISFDSQAQWPSEGKKPVTIKEDFEYIRDHLITDAYLLRDGKPVFTVFPYGDNFAEVRETLETVFPEPGADLLWSGAPRNEGENGCYAWVAPDNDTVDHSTPYCWSDPDNVGEGHLRSIYAAANTEGSSCEYVMHGVWPGFNNQFVSWAWSKDPDNPHIRPSVLVRETSRGNTLELTWQVYIDYLEKWAQNDASAHVPAPLIQLVTWNDYAETTTVEPTKNYGRVPLEMCQKYLEKARELWKSRK